MSGWGDFIQQWKTSWGVFLVGCFFIPQDEILWCAAIGLPFLARVACGRQEHEKGGGGDDVTKRRLGYLL